MLKAFPLYDLLFLFQRHRTNNLNGISDVQYLYDDDVPDPRMHVHHSSDDDSHDDDDDDHEHSQSIHNDNDTDDDMPSEDPEEFIRSPGLLKFKRRRSSHHKNDLDDLKDRFEEGKVCVVLLKMMK